MSWYLRSLTTSIPEVIHGKDSCGGRSGAECDRGRVEHMGDPYYFYLRNGKFPAYLAFDSITGTQVRLGR